MNVTLKNSFHNTETTLRVAGDSLGREGMYLSYRQTCRAWKALCGIEGCQCSRVAGDRMNGLHSEQITQDRSARRYAELIDTRGVC
jgi:hypothetical protein